MRTKYSVSINILKILKNKNVIEIVDYKRKTSASVILKKLLKYTKKLHIDLNLSRKSFKTLRYIFRGLICVTILKDFFLNYIIYILQTIIAMDNILKNVVSFFQKR